MHKASSRLKETFALLRTLFVPLAVIYLLNRTFLLLYLRNVVNTPTAILMTVVLHIPFRVFFLSGIYASLVEIVSNEAMILHPKSILRNARTYWPYYLMFATVPVVLYYALFAFLPGKPFPLTLVTSHCDILVVYALICVVIRKKYLQPMGLASREVRFERGDFVFVIALFAAASLSYYIFQLPAVQFSKLWTVPLFAHMYLNFAIALYLTRLLLEAYPEIAKKFDPDREVFIINPLTGDVFNCLAFTFIRPNSPISVVLRALTPKSYGIREFDRRPWRSRYIRSGKLVAITCLSATSAEAYRIARKFRRAGSTVIMGGPHVTYLPDEALQYCDAVVIGEAEGVWPEVIRDYENGTLKKTYMGIPAPENYAAVHKTLLASAPERIRDFLETTRGCKFRCYFCTIPAIFKGRLTQKDPQDIVELLNKIKSKHKEVVFLDNNIYSDPGYTRKLFQAIKPLGIRWSALSSIDIAQNDEVLKLAKESGCRTLLFGYEILSGSEEKKRGGKFSMAEKYLMFSKKVKKMGIWIEARFIFGFDSDTLASLWKIFVFVLKIRPKLTVVNMLTPLPGAQCYADMVKANRLTNLNWRSYSIRFPVFRHPTMNRFILSLGPPLTTVLIFMTTTTFGSILTVILLLAMTGLFLATKSGF